MSTNRALAAGSVQSSVFATVIVPTFNQAAYLPAALDSLLAQTDADWEAIIVNDGSTDDTPQIAEAYARRDGRFRCIHKVNGGVASALNAGLATARGEWIHWLSSDDMFEPDKLATNRRWIRKHPETRFFFSYFTLLRQATGVRERRELWGPLPVSGHQLLTLFFRNYISGISICVSRSAWEEVGFFDESLHYAQDYDQWLRLLQRFDWLFIPEWTVVSRNHAEQGSETFPDACYFDTAKAAIRFVNLHSFAELLPSVALHDAIAATSAVTAALDVASDRSAFLYCLGYHPALVLRVVEWVFSDECPHEDLRPLVRRRIGENAFAEGDDDWGWMWRQLAVAVCSAMAGSRYMPICPETLALREYRQRRLLDCGAEETIRDYLMRFEGITPEEPPAPLGARGPRVALLLNSSSQLGAFASMLGRLACHGARIVCLVADEERGSVWQESDWGTIVRVAAFDRDSLPWLGEVEFATAPSELRIPVWLDALCCAEIAGPEDAALFEQRVLEAFGKPTGQLRTVVFLERVFWGGGAERVVADLARHLDRRRYRPIVLTMFEEHTAAPDFGARIQPLNLGRNSGGRRSATDAGCQAESLNMSASHRLVSRLRAIYARWLPADLRARLRVGQRVQQMLRRSSLRAAHSTTAPRPTSPERVFQVQQQGMDEGASMDYVSAALHHNAQAEHLANALRGIGSDAVVVAVMEEAAVVAWMAQAAVRFPYVVSLHTFESLCMPDIFVVPARCRAESRLLAAACNDAYTVTLPSQGCCDDLVSHFRVASGRVTKISNPVNCASVRRHSFQHDPRAEHWRVTARGFRIVHVGRLDPQKNHDLLLAAGQVLKRRGQSFSLAIVGDGHDRARVEGLANSLDLRNEVIFPGEQKNPFPWIAAADALLLTSRFEAFSLVLVEAMACGTPVISVDCPAGPREVLAGGKCGILVRDGNPVAIADAVERLMSSPALAKDFSEAGYGRAEDFDIKKVVLQWQSLIDALPVAPIDRSAQETRGYPA